MLDTRYSMLDETIDDARIQNRVSSQSGSPEAQDQGAQGLRSEAYVCTPQDPQAAAQRRAWGSGEPGYHPPMERI